jgi:tetratricopeptide (TPR) repeat protein
MQSMVEIELKNKLFQAETIGLTFARDLLRSLTTIPFENAKIVLDTAMQSDFISNCFQEECQIFLLNDTDIWLSQLDDKKKNCHIQLLIRALGLKKFTIEPPLLQSAMHAALVVNDFIYAKAAAMQIIEGNETSDNASVFFSAYDVLGRVYSGSGDLSLGLQYFIRGAEKAHSAALEFEEWDAQTNAVSCLYSMDRHLEALNTIEKAEIIARRLKRKGMLCKTLLDKGNSMYALGKIRGAGPVFTEALAEAINDGDLKRQSDALGNLGIIEYYGNKFDSARDYHVQALAISRQINNAESIQFDLNNLASAEFKLGLYDQAIEHKEEALKFAISRNDQAEIQDYKLSIQQMYQLSGKLQYQDESEKHQDDRQNTLFLSNKNVKEQSNAAGTIIEKDVRNLLNANKLNDAIALVVEHLKEYPADHSVRCLYGALLSVEGKEQEARKQFNEIIRADPDNLGAYYRLYTSYQKNKEVSKILTDYKQKLFNEPFNAGVRMIIALASADSGKFDEAIQLGMAAANLRQQEELPYRVLVEIQWLKAMSQLTNNWEAAWATFSDCLIASAKLLGFNSSNKAQWYTYAANIFQKFALDSHRINPPFDVGMGTPEIQILALAMEYFKKSEELDETRNHTNEIGNIEATILALARPEKITLTASYMLDDGHDETALVLLLVSLQMDNLQGKTYQEISKYFFKRGNIEESLKYLRKAIEIEPENTEYTELKILYQNQVKFMETKKSK